MNKVKILVLEGVDATGKSTLIKNIFSDRRCRTGAIRQLTFPKVLPSGALLRINDEKSFELLLTMFYHLDRQVTYVLDRFMMSNLVYDEVLRGEDVSLSKKYMNIFAERFDLKQIILTRPHITSDFEDDNIKMPRDTFNECINAYQLLGTNYPVLNYDGGKLIDVNTDVARAVSGQMVEFINS